jgi:uncharacterized membrane protein YfcA
MFKARAIFRSTFFSLLGIMALYLLLQGSHRGLSPEQVVAEWSDLAFEADEVPTSEALAARIFAGGASAVLGGHGPAPLLKPFLLSLREMGSEPLSMAVFGGIHSFCLQFSFFRILPNAP